MHVEPLRVGAIGPRHDMRGPQQRRLGDAGERTTAAPVGHQGFAKHILADALDDQPLGFGRLRQAFDLRLKSFKRGFGQAYRKLVDAVERAVELRQNREAERRQPGPGTGEVGSAPISAMAPE